MIAATIRTAPTEAKRPAQNKAAPPIATVPKAPPLPAMISANYLSIYP